MTGVQGLLNAGQQMGVGTAGASAAEAQDAAAPFGSIFRSMVKESGDLETKAQRAVTGLMNGSGVEVHDAMIATQKADMAFELGLQMRNKAVAAYQQMMNMQF